MCVFLYREKQHNGTFSKLQTAAHLKKNFIFKVTKEHRCPNKLECNNKNPSKLFNKTCVQNQKSLKR